VQLATGTYRLVRVEANVGCRGRGRSAAEINGGLREMPNLVDLVESHAAPRALHGVCLLGGARHMTVGCDGGARAQAGVRW
jgi:hypothetical protein